MQMQQQQKERQRLGMGEVFLAIFNLVIGLLFLVTANLNSTSPIPLLLLSLLSGIFFVSALAIFLRLRKPASVMQALLSLIAFFLTAAYAYTVAIPSRTPITLPNLIIMGTLVLLAAFFAGSAWFLKHSGED